ncbi:LIM and calponin homology domains-containing protein 1-like [Coregonus clupeaformis]|uniref:LIM and calponin homology domains-containing protein 1-like n=1 Tax=Coregonus clupeaformis TaxID=59861 RepID=UPI001E1C7C2F|nr:LIM and calponin homology domains-containing protein 1-like [Coregonus clupeaformis]
MASTGAECEEPHLPQDEPRHPEPAFREAQKWIEEVTGRSFGENDFRSSLENGILLCELLGSIRPGLVQKINRLPTPIAGLDNLSVFLRGCEELGLKGSQLFDPGDLQGHLRTSQPQLLTHCGLLWENLSCPSCEHTVGYTGRSSPVTAVNTLWATLGDPLLSQL